MLHIEGKAVELFPSEKRGAPLVLLNGEAGEGAMVHAAVKGMTDVEFTLAAVSGLRWEDDLTPWPIPPIRNGQAPCAGQGLPAAPEYVALAGYSLAGLFALYAMYRVDLFARIASASGSLWYPDFVAFAKTHALARRPDALYLSLGDREGKTRNSLMRPVEGNTCILAEYYCSAGINTRLEMNPGGHFNDPIGRMARAIAWTLEV